MDIKDLVEEVGYTPKRKAACHGGEYSSPCPFCKDGDDRFLVWPNRRNGNGDYNGGRYSCRICKKYGDAITFLRDLYGLNYLDACAQLKLEPKITKTTTVKKPYKPKTISEPADAWIEKANIFVEWCHSKLMSCPVFLDQVQARGFTIEAIKRFKLGFNPGDNRGRDFKRERKDWGLPDLVKEDLNKKLWLPVGIVIPTFALDGRVIKIKVRRTAYEKENEVYAAVISRGEEPKWKTQKYVVISGSQEIPSIYGDTNSPCGLVLESELDALVVQQEAGDMAYCVALGGSTKPIDAQTDKLLRKTPMILFLPDFDHAGLIAWKKWEKMFPKINRILTPHEKSAGDYFIAGGNIRNWLDESIVEIQRKFQN